MTGGRVTRRRHRPPPDGSSWGKAVRVPAGAAAPPWWGARPCAPALCGDAIPSPMRPQEVALAVDLLLGWPELALQAVSHVLCTCQHELGERLLRHRRAVVGQPTCDDLVCGGQQPLQGAIGDAHSRCEDALTLEYGRHVFLWRDHGSLRCLPIGRTVGGLDLHGLAVVEGEA